MVHQLLAEYVSQTSAVSNDYMTEQLSDYAQQLMNSVFEIQDLRARLVFIRQKRQELQEILLQADDAFTDDDLQLLQADDIALGMLERAYLDHLLDTVVIDQQNIDRQVETAQSCQIRREA